MDKHFSMLFINKLNIVIIGKVFWCYFFHAVIKIEQLWSIIAPHH